MKIICDRAALLEAVNLVAAVVPARSPSPALSCLKLTAARSAGVGSLTVSGTDAEVSLEVTLSQVDLQQPGVAVVSAEKIRQILQTVGETDPTVQVEVEGDSCQIRSTKSRFRIFVFPSGDFPPLPDYARVRASGAAGGGGEARALFTHPAGSLLKLVHRTAFATARETSRYAINGVLFRRDGRRLEMVATDGRRLALCRTS
ncbi:MAG: hypothetical protein C0468_06980, partial [Planctomyces sp.]|nr:hypothetical protein [Planctomyces sp.]